MTLDARLAVTRGPLSLDLDLTVPSGAVLALLGPRGAGKTTALEAVAGLVPLDAGHVRVGERTLDDTAGGIHLKAAERGIGMVFQDYRLFSHLSVVENVEFGVRAQGMKKKPARDRAAEWLEAVGATNLADRAPSTLSNDEAQRVALARALAIEPSVLLLDEPLAGIEASLRMRVRGELAQRLRENGAATVLVTHDLVDALVLADSVIVLEEGRAVQAGTPVEIAASPSTQFVARLVGLNLGPAPISSKLEEGISLAFAPSAVRVTRDRPRDDPSSHVWRATSPALEQLASLVRARATTPMYDTILADIAPTQLAGLNSALGTQVWMSVSVRDARAVATELGDDLIL